MYLTKEITQEEAFIAWRNSDSASLFSEPTLLNSLNINSRYIGGYKNDELMVVWPLIETENEFNFSPPFSYYFGPYLLNNNLNEPPYKRYRNNLEVINCLIEKVEKIAPKINFSLSPEFLDLRPFQWWNFHKQNNHTFKIDLKYTARYFFNKNIDEDQIISSFRSDDKRKKIRDIKKKNHLKTRLGVFNDIEIYSKMYSDTIKKSGGSISKKDLDFLDRLIKLASQKKNIPVTPTLIELNISDFDSPIGFQLLLIGKKHSFAIAQSTTPEGRELNGNVFLNFQSLCYARDNNILCFDFNGANSPNRADDKHAFGAKEAIYFDLRLE